jgi:hypothetical protein
MSKKLTNGFFGFQYQEPLVFDSTNESAHRARDACRAFTFAFHWRASLKLALPKIRAA